MNDSTHGETGWHLDKRVPLSLIITILLQTAAAVWWARGLESRVVAVEAQQHKQDMRDSRQDEESRATVNLLLSRIDRLDGKLDRLIERTPGNGNGSSWK